MTPLFTCFNRKQVILKLCEEHQAQRSTLQKVKPYGLGHITIELINQDRWYGYIFPSKNLILILEILLSVTPIEIREKFNKKIIFGMN